MKLLGTHPHNNGKNSCPTLIYARLKSFLSSHGSSIWDGQIWYRYRSDGSYATRSYHEEHNSGEQDLWSPISLYHRNYVYPIFHKYIIPIHNLRKHVKQLFIASFILGCHGWYHCHLRGGGSSPHRWPACTSWCWLRLHTLQVSSVQLASLEIKSQSLKHITLQGLCALGGRAFRGSLWACSRLCHWNRRRRRRTRHSTAAQALRRHDPHPYLRRGARTLRAHRRHLPVRQEIERAVIIICKTFFRGINIHDLQSIGLLS